jgi:hypothetical protein
MRLFERTGEEHFLEPIPRALAYYRASLRPDGRLVRFYELQTNRPLYFTKDYQLTYSDADMPTHYAFIVESQLEAIAAGYGRVKSGETLYPIEASPPSMTDSLAHRARTVIDALDDRGAWVEAGRLRYHGEDDDTREIISSRTFIEHLGVLSRFIAASRE